MQTIKNVSKKTCAPCLKALGVQTRYNIYGYLKDTSQASVSEIVTFIGLQQPTVSYHLKDMQSLGLLKSKKEGKKVYYMINSTCPYDGHECVLSNLTLKGV